MLKSRDKREESLTPGHGLTTVGWPKTLHGGIANVLNLKVQATNGTFPEFVEAVGNGQSYAWRQPDNQIGSFKNDFGKLGLLSDHSLLSLGDLLSRERELAHEYEIANDGWGNTDFGYVVAHEDYLRVIFVPHAGVDTATAVQSYGFPASAKLSVQSLPGIAPEQLQLICIDIAAIGEDRKKAAPLAIEQGSNVGWLIRPLPNGDNMIDLHRMYVEAFTLGMLSRYFPSKWMSLLRSDKGDIARSVILPAVARVESAFPQLLRDQLH